MPDSQTVSVVIVGGPTIPVKWFDGMKAIDAMKAAIDQTHDQQLFTYALQYFSGGLGDMVVMINQTYDTIGSKEHPYFYWDILVDGNPAEQGIDTLPLKQGGELKFLFKPYQTDTATRIMQTKYDARSRQ